MNTIQRINTTARFSDATIFNGILHYVEVPTIETADIIAQTHNIFDLTEQFLKEHNSGLQNLLMVTIYLTDMQDIQAMNQVYDQRIPNGHAPVRACVQVAALAHPHYKIEMAFVAAVNDPSKAI